MVTFTRVPYGEAARRARLQDRIVYAGLIAIAALLIGILVWVRALNQKPPGDADGLLRLCSPSSFSTSAVMMWMVIRSVGGVMRTPGSKQCTCNEKRRQFSFPPGEQ